MDIYLIRHADAERASSGISDFERKLTKEGKSSLRNSAEKWKNRIGHFDYIVSSPMIRALQTAKIVAEVFNYEGEIIKDSKLASGGKTEDLIEIANGLDGERIAFVGHQPDLSHHVANLISSDGAYIEFKKGAIAKISFNNQVQLSRGILEFLIPPIAAKER